MRVIQYNKLVRDRIPEIIEASGKKPIYDFLENDRYLEFLNKKLIEELNEYLQSGAVEELADMGEVMHAILEYKGVDIQEFQRIRTEKKEKSGGFSKKILLKEVVE